jgi:hypothetical protein
MGGNRLAPKEKSDGCETATNGGLGVAGGRTRMGKRIVGVDRSSDRGTRNLVSIVGVYLRWQYSGTSEIFGP